MSLIDCIKAAGKAVDKKDADFLLQKREQYAAKGLSEVEADNAALKDLTDSMDEELTDIADRVEKSGGKVNRPQTQETAPMPVTMEDGQVVDANEVMKSLDDEIQSLDDIIRCAYA